MTTEKKIVQVVENSPNVCDPVTYFHRKKLPQGTEVQSAIKNGTLSNR
jgi:hypothetical protein